MAIYPVTIPLLNPNEPEARLAGLHVTEGQRVEPGQALCTLETTKSAADLLAEQGGYVRGLRFTQGQAMAAGEVLCYLADTQDETLPEIGLPAPAGRESASTSVPDGLRITQPALALARQRGLDLSSLPSGPLVTEAVVRSLLEGPRPEVTAAGPAVSPAAPFDPTAILLYGGGGHCKMLIDLLRSRAGQRIAGILDDRLPAGQTIMGVPVLGGVEKLAGLYEQGVRLAVNAVGGIGNVAVRVAIFDRLAAAGFSFPAVVHARAVVEPSASLAPGAQVFAQAYVGSEAQVGFGAIVSTGAIVSHDCQLEDYAILSPGAILAGEVQVGSRALVGMGATVNLRVKIGAGTRIGNGATVKADVPPGGIVRAGGVWPEN